MAEETLRYLKDEGVKRIVVLNRHRARAEGLAAEFGGLADDFDHLEQRLAEADVIVSTTGATETLISHQQFERIRQTSERKPVFILDLGAPRDFDPSISQIDDNVLLFDIDRLKETCEANRQLRVSEVEHAKKIIRQQTDRFMHEIYHRATGPVIQRLREQWSDISRSEVDLLCRKVPELTDVQRAAIEKTIHRIVNKLLHPPLETLKDEAKAGTPHGLLDAIRHLFHLGE